GFDTVARVTGDCPFVNAELVAWCLSQCEKASQVDLASTKGRFPVGLDVEIFSATRLAALHAGGRLTVAEREHLTLYFYNHPAECTTEAIAPPPAWQCTDRRFTVDTQDDYRAACELANAFDRHDFTIDALVARAAA